MYIDTHTHTHTDTHTYRHTHIQTHTHRHTHTDTHRPAAHFISFFYFQKRNKTKKDKTIWISVIQSLEGASFRSKKVEMVAKP